MKIYVDAGLIGDALCCIPYLYSEYTTHGEITIGPNINSWVLKDIDFPIILNEQLQDVECAAKLTATCSWHFSWSHKIHMAQGHYGFNGKPWPNIPMTIPVKETACELPPGVVFAPFSKTDYQNNKLWPFDRWLELSHRFTHPVYVVGCDSDDWSWVTGTKLIPVINQSMAFIVSLLKQCKLFVSIDTGIAHLAHFINISTHAFLYPTVTAWGFVDNPNAQKVIDFPLNVTVERMLNCCKKIPNWQG
jgi:hypothetical protein